jgi:hypothetical protein
VNDIPVLDIQINDDAFTAFKRKFDDFQKQLDGTLPQWSKAGAQIQKLSADFKGLQKTVAEQRAVGKELAQHTDLAAMSAAMMGDIFLSSVRSSKSFAANIATSTLHLAKWTALTGLFSSLIGAGGLYGINRLAQGVSARRTGALGLGVTYGESASFDVAFSRLGDTQSFLAGSNEALTDVTKMTPFVALGIGSKVRGMDAANAFAEALPEIKKLVDRTPIRQLGTIEKAYDLDALGFDRQSLMRLRTMNAAEVAALVTDYHNEKDPLGIPAQTAQMWQDLDTQLGRAWTEIEVALERNLVNVTPGLTKLSGSFVKLVDTIVEDKNGKVGELLQDVGKHIEGFAKSIGSGSALQSLHTFVDNFKLAKSDFDALNSWLSSHGDVLKTVIGAAIGARVGGVFGWPGAIAGGVIGALPGTVSKFGGDIDRAMVRDAKGGAPRMYGGTPLAPGGVDPKNRGSVHTTPEDRKPGGGAYGGAYGGGSSPNRAHFGHPHDGNVIRLPDVDVHAPHNDRKHFGRRPARAQSPSDSGSPRAAGDINDYGVPHDPRFSHEAAYRDKNPFNVSLTPYGRSLGGTPDPIQGQSGHGKFPTVTAGFMAGQELLLRRYNHGRRTLADQFRAPGAWSTNPAAAQAIGRRLGIGIHDDLNLHDPAAMDRLEKALIAQEGRTGNRLLAEMGSPAHGHEWGGTAQAAEARAHHLDPSPKRPVGAGRNNLMHHPAHVGQRTASAVIVQDNTGGAVTVTR